MIDLEVTQNIRRPAADVYAFVVTNYIKNHPRWDPRAVRSELNDGANLAVGAAGVEVRKQMGRENRYDFRVTELTPDHVTFDATSGSTKFGAVWAVNPQGNASQLTITFHLAFGGPMHLFEPLMKGSVRGEMRQAADNIKRLVEAS